VEIRQSEPKDVQNAINLRVAAQFAVINGNVGVKSAKRD
jgi:hypothetical protein